MKYGRLAQLRTFQLFDVDQTVINHMQINETQLRYCSSTVVSFICGLMVRTDV
jgi:hypothetical protein